MHICIPRNHISNSQFHVPCRTAYLNGRATIVLTTSMRTQTQTHIMRSEVSSSRTWAGFAARRAPKSLKAANALISAISTQILLLCSRRSKSTFFCSVYCNPLLEISLYHFWVYNVALASNQIKLYTI